MKKPNDENRLHHIIDAIRQIELYLADFDKDKFLSDAKTQDAVIRQLLIVGEAVNSLTRDLKSKYPQVEWHLATATRNRLVHGYFDIDAEIVWDTTQNDLPELEQKIIEILEELKK